MQQLLNLTSTSIAESGPHALSPLAEFSNKDDSTNKQMDLLLHRKPHQHKRHVSVLLVDEYVNMQSALTRNGSTAVVSAADAALGDYTLSAVQSPKLSPISSSTLAMRRKLSVSIIDESQTMNRLVFSC